MTQLFLQRENIIFLPEPLGEFLDCMVKSMLLFLRCGMTELHILNFVNLHKKHIMIMSQTAVMRKEGIWPISVARFTDGRHPSCEYMLIETKKHEHMQAVHYWKMEEFTFLADKKWSKNLIDICATFHAGENDDIVDTCTQAWFEIA